MSFFGLNFKQCMRVKKIQTKTGHCGCNFPLNDEPANAPLTKKKILSSLNYMYFAAAGFEKKNICQVFSKWNAHCTYLLRFEVQKVKLLNSLFNKLCIYLFYTYKYTLVYNLPYRMENFV